MKEGTIIFLVMAFVAICCISAGYSIGYKDGKADSRIVIAVRTWVI